MLHFHFLEKRVSVLSCPPLIVPLIVPLIELESTERWWGAGGTINGGRSIESQVYVEDSLKSLENFVRELRERIDNLNFEERRELIKLLVKRVIVKEDGVVDVEVIVPQIESQRGSNDESHEKQPTCFPSIAQLRHRQSPCNWGKSTQTLFCISIKPYFRVEESYRKSPTNNKERMVRAWVEVSLSQYEKLNRLKEETGRPLSEIIRGSVCRFVRKKDFPVSATVSYLPKGTRDKYKSVSGYFARSDWGFLEEISKNTRRPKTELVREAVDEYLAK